MGSAPPGSKAETAAVRPASRRSCRCIRRGSAISPARTAIPGPGRQSEGSSPGAPSGLRRRRGRASATGSWRSPGESRCSTAPGGALRASPLERDVHDDDDQRDAADPAAWEPMAGLVDVLAISVDGTPERARRDPAPRGRIRPDSREPRGRPRLGCPSVHLHADAVQRRQPRVRRPPRGCRGCSQRSGAPAHALGRAATTIGRPARRDRARRALCEAAMLEHELGVVVHVDALSADSSSNTVSSSCRGGRVEPADRRRAGAGSSMPTAS